MSVLADQDLHWFIVALSCCLTISVLIYVFLSARFQVLYIKNCMFQLCVSHGSVNIICRCWKVVGFMLHSFLCKIKVQLVLNKLCMMLVNSITRRYTYTLRLFTVEKL